MQIEERMSLSEHQDTLKMFVKTEMMTILLLTGD